MVRMRMGMMGNKNVVVVDDEDEDGSLWGGC